MRKITILKTKRKLQSKYRYRLRRNLYKINLKSFYFSLDADFMSKYIIEPIVKKSRLEVSDCIKLKINDKNEGYTKAFSFIPKKLLALIFKFKNTINNSVIKHLEEEFSKKTIDIINYISILFSINNYRIFS